MNGLTGGELPSPRADVEIIREEDFDFVFKGKMPGFSGELDLKRRGSDRSPTARATTMLILVAEACLAAITIAVIGKLVAAAALLLIIAALTAFAGVLITGTIISFHRDGAAPPQREITSGHLPPSPIARAPGGNGTVRPLSREAHQNGHALGKEPKGKKDGQGSRPAADRRRRG